MRNPSKNVRQTIKEFESVQTVTNKEYPRIVFTEYVDRCKFYGTVRVVEIAEDVFRFEKSDGDDAMKNPIWKPLRDEEYKGIAEHLLKNILLEKEYAVPLNTI